MHDTPPCPPRRPSPTGNLQSAQKPSWANCTRFTTSHPGTSSLSRPPPGAHVLNKGVFYSIWAPHHATVNVIVTPAQKGPDRRLELTRQHDGTCSCLDFAGHAGDRYTFELPGGEHLPDIASRFQPEGVTGPSECINPQSYKWLTTGWKPPPQRDHIIYELHIGTFTQAGTFRSAIDRLDHVVELGATAIQIMPVGNFAGRRNWGYDGVMLYAPARCYGRPDDLRALVDAAHLRGLTVILDVVYNHFGPGNLLTKFSPYYFHKTRANSWGTSLNLDGEHAAHARGAFLIAEDERNPVELLCRADGTGSQLDGVWSDDFHHVVRVALTGVRESYFASYEGTDEELAKTLSAAGPIAAKTSRS